MHPQYQILALLMGAFSGWAIIFLTRGIWVRSKDARERDSLRQLAPLGGAWVGCVITTMVLIQPSIELKALLVPITAGGTLCFFAVGTIYVSVFGRLARKSCRSNRKH